MILLDPLWDFTALVTRERREKLLSVASFDEVIEQIVRGTVDSFKVKPRRNPPCEGCSRAFFRLLIGACVYDAFFNSPVGYRGRTQVSLKPVSPFRIFFKNKNIIQRSTRRGIQCR